MASITIYSECSPLELGCHVFSDIGQTTPLTSTWISDGIFKYQLDGDGVIIYKTYCDTIGFMFEITLTDPTVRDAYPGEEIEIDPVGEAKKFTLPLISGYTYSGTIDWGDNSMSLLSTWSGNTHTYTNFGTYIIRIDGQCPGWSFATYPHDKWKISDIIFWGGSTAFTGFDYISGGFKNCNNLKSSGRYGNIDFNGDYAVGFYQTFYNCPTMEIMPYTFYNAGEETTKFLNQSPNFTGCFYRTSFYGVQGTAPNLWDCSFGSGTPVKTSCFGGAGNSLTSISNYNDIPVAWK